MRADAFLAALEAAPVVDLDALAGSGGLVVLAPHPDDESLGCGGLIAQACEQGRDVRLLILTDGSGSHPTSETFTAEMLRDLREAETLEAARALGLPVEHVSFLRLQDAWVPSSGPVAEEAARAVVEAARACRASVVLTTWRHDPHCDHKAAAAIVDIASASLPGVRLVAFTVWGGALPPETEVSEASDRYRLNVSPQRDAKRRAIAAHVSQTAGLAGTFPGAFQLADTMIDRMCGPYEHYWDTKI